MVEVRSVDNQGVVDRSVVVDRDEEASGQLQADDGPVCPGELPEPLGRVWVGQHLQ